MTFESIYFRYCLNISLNVSINVYFSFYRFIISQHFIDIIYYLSETLFYENFTYQSICKCGFKII